MKSIEMKLLCIVLSIILNSCYNHNRLEKSNPTNYIFNANVENVKIAIKKAKETSQIRGFILNFHDKNDYKYGYLFKNSKNVNDAILYSILSIESKIYFRFGKPLYYQTDYHIHLDSIFDNKTKVEIFTLNPSVIVFGIGVGHLGYIWDKKVPPSTIEEYEILLAIGDQLGETGMPACNYPHKYLKYRAKQQERIKKQRQEFEQLMLQNSTDE